MNNFLYILILFFLLNFFIINNKIINNFLLDYPDNKRKFHKKPTPLIGGLIIFINILLYEYILFFFFNKTVNYNIVVGVTLFFFSGLIDDKYKIKPANKIFLIVSSCLIIEFLSTNIINLEFIKFSNTVIEIPKKFQFLITIFCILLLSNASNMMDGINGISITLFILVFLFLSKFLLVNYFYLVMIIISVLIILLVANLKNKLFLGDSGINTLVFLSAFLIIFIHKFQLTSFDKRYLLAEDIFILFIIPGIDMLRVFIERIYKKKSPFQSDTNHLHHILLLKYKKNKIVYVIYSLLLAIPILLNFLFTNKQLYIIIITIIFYIYAIRNVNNDIKFKKN
jgi:UDP-GlcNAc:undecaprenyl-phosphate GlcNAc-1-phosphate transferase